MNVLKKAEKLHADALALIDGLKSNEVSGVSADVLQKNAIENLEEAASKIAQASGQVQEAKVKSDLDVPADNEGSAGAEERSEENLPDGGVDNDPNAPEPKSNQPVPEDEDAPTHTGVPADPEENVPVNDPTLPDETTAPQGGGVNPSDTEAPANPNDVPTTPADPTPVDDEGAPQQPSNQ